MEEGIINLLSEMGIAWEYGTIQRKR
jgi:hypothetical protein